MKPNERVAGTIVASFVLLASTGLVAGCGGSSSSTDSTSQSSEATQSTTVEKAVTKAEYIASADAICRRATKPADKLIKQRMDLAGSVDISQIADLAPRIEKLIQQQAKLKDSVTDHLEGLDAPDSGTASDYIKARRVVADKTRATSDAIRAYANNPTSDNATAINAANAAEVKAAKEQAPPAKKFGFNYCGVGK